MAIYLKVSAYSGKVFILFFLCTTFFLSAQEPPVGRIAAPEQDLMDKEGRPKPGYPLLPLRFSAKNKAMDQGDTTTLVFVCFDFTNIAAIQFALKFDTAYLKFVSVSGYPNGPLNANNFGLFNIDGGEIRCVYSSATGSTVDDRTRIFAIRLVAQKTLVQVSDHLRSAPEILPGIAADEYLIPRPVVLSLTEDLAEPKGLIPGVKLMVRSGFIYVDVSRDVFDLELEVVDANHQVYITHRGFLHEGLHQFPYPQHLPEGNFTIRVRDADGDVYWLIDPDRR